MATPISTTQFQVSGTKQKSKGTPSTASTALVGTQAEKQGLHDTKTNAIDGTENDHPPQNRFEMDGQSRVLQCSL